MPEVNDLAEKIKATRIALVNDVGDDVAYACADASGTAAEMVSTVKQRSVFGRLFGIDPATVYLIVQLALLVLELARKFRELRNAKS